MITRYLPEFKQVEPNNLVGLRSGHLLSQFPANSGIKTKTIGNYKYIENGIIVGLNSDGTIGNYTSAVTSTSTAASHKTKFIHFTEELNTVLDELKYFAVPVERNAANTADDFTSTYPRCVALYAGDTFTTDNYDNTAAITGDGYATVSGGVLTLQSATTDAEFIAKKTTLPNGSVGYEFTVL